MSSSSSQQDQPSTSSAAKNLQSPLQSPSQIQQSTTSTFSTKFPSNPVEILNLKKLMSQHESIKIVEIKNCPTTLDASKLISNSIFKSLLEPLKNFTALILKINEQLNEQHAEKPKIHEFKIERNFLISYESQKAANEKIIYWKNGKEGKYLTINLMKGFSAEMTNFVRNYLIDNVNMNNDKSINNNFQLVYLNNSKNYNLLMKAVEYKQSSALIDELLHLPFDINQKSNDGKTAADIAWKNENFQILLQLFEANSTLPNDFYDDELEADESSQKIREFLKITQVMHDAIKTNDLTTISNLIKQKPNLRYFYNLSNVSAAKVALNTKQFKAYKILLENECSIGPNENLNEIVENIYENDEQYEPKRKKLKSEVTNAHDGVSKPLPEKHLLILCANSQICHDDQHDKHRLKVIREAFNNLNENSIARQILQLTSMHKNFIIYFDFNRSSIEFMNPAGGDESTRGLYDDFDGIQKSSLYIGAKELLLNDDSDDKFAALGTLAHELCHFAMNLTFCNDAKPYAIDDEENKVKFDAIIEKCKVILLEILSRTKEIKKFQELIAFCENLLQKTSDELIEIINNYEIKISKHEEIICKSNEMIEIYEEQIAGIKEHNMKLNKYVSVFKEKLDSDTENKIIKRIIKCYEDRIKLNKVTLTTKINEIEQLKVQIIDNEKLIEECNEKLQLCNSNHQALITVYQNEISKLEEEIEDVKARSDYEEIVSLVFNNYKEVLWPAELIVRVPHMIVHYKNDPQRLNELKVSFKDLFDYYNDVVVPLIGQTLSMLEKLFNNSSEIKHNDLTDAYKAKIHHSKVNFQGADVKFNEIIEDKNSEIFQFLCSEQICGNLIQNKSLIIGCAQEVKTKFYVERDFIDYDYDIKNIKMEWNPWSEEILNNLKSFDQISLIAVATKMILLSDHAGAGKTTTFKHLAVKLKNKFPHFWISFIDLKRHLEIYEKFEQNFQVLEVLIEILSITDEFEIEIFIKLFNSNKVILLYDGVDEIAPKFKDFFINFIESVKNSTENQQWIATRPQHMQELREKFNQKAYNLLPYDEDQKIEFIENVLKTKNVENIEAEDVLGNIYRMTLYGDNIDSPLMLQMMTELYVNDKILLKDSNFFSLYDRMIEMKKDIVVKKKGEIVNSDRDSRKAKLTIWQIHQIYALKLLFKYDFKDRFNEFKKIDINEFQLLKRWKRENSKWTPEAISRYGFLYVDNWNTDEEFPDFVHRTFAEFFVAQFAIQDLHELDEDDDDEMSEKEIKMRTKLLIEICLNNFDIRKFILSFIDIHKSKKMHKYFTKLITSNEMQELLIGNSYSSLDYDLIQFLSIDERFLKKFRFNGNMTIFQYSVNKSDIDDIHKIVEIYKRYLGADWINHTGYSVKENFLMPNYEEIYEILKQDSKDLDNRYSELKKLFEFFNSIDQLEIPQNDLLKFFGKHFGRMCKETFYSSFLTQNLMKIIQNHFHDCKREFLRTITENIEFEISYIDYAYDSVIKFIHDLEEFFRSDETICVDDIKYFAIKLVSRFCGMKSLIKSYKENKFTKSEIQNCFIKYSVEIINYMCEYGALSGTSINDFIFFFREIFNVQSEQSQLKKFLEMLCEDESRFLPKVDQSLFSNLDNSEISYENEWYSERIKRFKRLRTTLLELAKEIKIPDDEFEKLSRRLKNKQVEIISCKQLDYSAFSRGKPVFYCKIV